MRRPQGNFEVSHLESILAQLAWRQGRVAAPGGIMHLDAAGSRWEVAWAQAVAWCDAHPGTAVAVGGTHGGWGFYDGGRVPHFEHLRPVGGGGFYAEVGDDLGSLNLLGADEAPENVRELYDMVIWFVGRGGDMGEDVAAQRSGTGPVKVRLRRVRGKLGKPWREACDVLESYSEFYGRGAKKVREAERSFVAQALETPEEAEIFTALLEDAGTRMAVGSCVWKARLL